MTNIVPQAPTHNRQAQRLLEEYARTLVSKDNELYIIAGTAGKGDKGDNGKASGIAIGITNRPCGFIEGYRGPISRIR